MATPVASSWPFLNALMDAADSMVRNVRESSLPALPHHFGLRTKVMVPFCLSKFWIWYGPALTPGAGC
ncbi:MAG TPA: hypothetical protein VGP04_12055 [Pseudonocardiaceae bacterium]|nr:hypothetical protein [Pseudonocardiaceae bacterium]